MQSLRGVGQLTRRTVQASPLYCLLRSYSAAAASERVATISQQDAKYILPLYGRAPLLFTHGEGCNLFTDTGDKFLDCMSGVAVNSLGHSHPAVVEPAIDQMKRLIHVSNYYHNEYAAPLAERLVADTAFAENVFFCNSGTEALEAALKFARKKAKQIDPEKTNIVACTKSFHGRSMGAVSCTHKEAYRLPFMPVMAGVQFATYNDVDSLKALVNEKTAMVLFEPVQGEGGVTPVEKDFMCAARQLCDQYQSSLVFDEVQIGLGRSGALWAHQLPEYDVIPDMMAFAKPIAGGIPMGGVLLNRAIKEVIKPGDHGTTFGGGPLACRVALSVYDTINQPPFLKHVRDMSNHILDRLRNEIGSHEEIQDIRGKGLLLGIQLKSKMANDVLAHAREHHKILMINAGDHVIRLAPPLIITQAEVDRVVDAIVDGVKSGK